MIGYASRRSPFQRILSPLPLPRSPHHQNKCHQHPLSRLTLLAASPPKPSTTSGTAGLTSRNKLLLITRISCDSVTRMTDTKRVTSKPQIQSVAVEKLQDALRTLKEEGREGEGEIWGALETIIDVLKARPGSIHHPCRWRAMWLGELFDGLWGFEMREIVWQRTYAPRSPLAATLAGIAGDSNCPKGDRRRTSVR